MARVVEFLLELVGLGALMSLLAFVTWTKMALGAILALAGAYFPTLRKREDVPGSAQINLQKIAVQLRGGARFAVVIAGLVLIIGAMLDGHEGYLRQRSRVADADQATGLARAPRLGQPSDEDLKPLVVGPQGEASGLAVSSRLGQLSAEDLKQLLADPRNAATLQELIKAEQALRQTPPGQGQADVRGLSTEPAAAGASR